jgi:putative transcriptional regulator
MMRSCWFSTGKVCDVKSHISNNIRRLRFDHDEMTQQALADQVGVTRQTVIAIEKGKYSPSLEVAFRMTSVFDVPLEDVFQFKE